MSIYSTLFSLICVTLLLACSPPSAANTDKTKAQENTELTDQETVLSPIDEVEQAHAKAEFLGHEAISFDIRLSFGGTERLNGRMTLATNSSRGVIEYANGNRLIFDGDKVYHNPDMEKAGSARFAAYTWSYFFMFPYKLSDPGTIWSTKASQELNGKVYDYQKLTFEAGTGDAPDDWYKLYVDPTTHLSEVAAYIVTAGGGTVEEAEVDPHAIKYETYSTVDGIPIANEWTFWAWREEGGLTKKLGEASLSNIKFESPDKDFYSPGKDFLEK